MRPGPGLVVMALAFISGARRGSTNTSSKLSSSSTASPSSSSASPSLSSPSPSSSSSSASSSSSSSSPEPDNTQPYSILFPSFLGGGGVLTPGNHAAANRQRDRNAPASAYVDGHFYPSNYPSPSPQLVLPGHLRQQQQRFDEPESPSSPGFASRAPTETRIARSIKTGPADARSSDIVGRAGGGSGSGGGGGAGEGGGGGGGGEALDVISNVGLRVKLPLPSADSSRSFDEDDILALVAEDDLLSEESFDRLSKLTDDKIGYINEEDYSSTEAGGGSGDRDTEDTAQERGLEARREAEESGGGKGDADQRRVESRQSTDDSGRSAVGANESVYAANLMSSSNDVAVIAEDASISHIANDWTAESGGRRTDLRKSIFESASPLTRLNPWISACDLAQPGIAPDLQGQCSAGTLPVAWVDEGPGPPTCPMSCEQLRLNNKENINIFNINANDNNNNNNNNNNNINSKLNHKNNNQNNNNNYYNNNLNNNKSKMAKLVRRDVHERATGAADSDRRTQQTPATSAAPSMSTTTRTTTTTTAANITATTTTTTTTAQAITTKTAIRRSAAIASAPLPTSAEGELASESESESASVSDADIEPMQQDGVGVGVGVNVANAVAVSRQSHNNNNIVKTRNVDIANANNLSNNLNTNSYELKFNQMHAADQTKGNANTQHNNNNNSNNKQRYRQQSSEEEGYSEDQQQQQQQQQQCLDYLGDTNETMPAHLCGLQSPSELGARLRTLRLKHCCERNVFSALHTVALNVTLSGGADCVRTLSDIMELDSLATRITCELAEILYRFDCRQVYSLIHQCDDCKEAYRRWVCSTLVPYFAEQSDIIMPASTERGGTQNTRSNGNNANDKSARQTASTSNFATANDAVSVRGRYTSLVERSYSNNNNNDKLEPLNNVNYENERRKRHISHNAAFDDVIQRMEYYNNTIATATARAASPTSISSASSSSAVASSKSERSGDDGCTWQQEQPEQQQHREEEQEEKTWQQATAPKQLNNFISTANSEDPHPQDPVIPKLLRRSKRKVEFRRRRRIRPCLSVCQTVEQKCPYLLPADRAPALPTQYAGEPTFLCLDQNVPQTGEQLHKSSHGPPECCYMYCGGAAHGVCTYCYAFAMAADAHDEPVLTNTTRRVHNVTLTAQNQLQLQGQQRVDDAQTARKSIVAIALKNISTALGGHALERLPYYAYYEGIYYYDDDTDDMPYEPLSGDCAPVPSVSTRCTIPYYASSASMQRPRPQSLLLAQLLWMSMSALFCLLSSCTAALQQQQQKKRPRNATITDCQRCVNGSRELATANNSSDTNSNNNCNTKAYTKRHRSSSTSSRSNSSKRARLPPRGGSSRRSRWSAGSISSSDDSQQKRARKLRFIFRHSQVRFSSSKMQINRSQSSTRISRTCNIIPHSNSKSNRNSSCNKNYRSFYYYNFNINDWWRRWWIRLRAPPFRHRHRHHRQRCASS